MLKFTKLMFLFFIISLVTSLELLAEDLYTLIGIQTSIKVENNKNIPTVGISYGLQDNNWRTLVGVNYGKSDNISSYNIILDIDKGIFNNFLKDSRLKTYVGLSFSLVGNEDSKSKTKSKDLGYGYGGKLGLVYIASNKVDIDFSFKYMLLEKLATKSNKSLNLSVNYFY